MKRIILTTGPALLHQVPLTDIHDDKNIYRINGAHGTLEEIEATVDEIRRQVPHGDILMDLPGNKVRTHGFAQPVELHKGQQVSIPSACFNYPGFYRHLKPGMTAWANDSVYELEVVQANEDRIVFLSKSDGLLLNNKGVHIRGIHGDIPFLFPKDRQLIELANRKKISFVGLSFVRTADNVKEAQALLDPEIQVISKVETLDAVEHINDILPLVRYILVDRGDLSTDIGIEKIPRYQKFIIEKAHLFEVKVFLATQVLKNMEDKPVPTIAEIDDLYSIITMGVYGVQMSEETAVGSCVRECVRIIDTMLDEVKRERIALV